MSVYRSKNHDEVMKHADLTYRRYPAEWSDIPTRMKVGTAMCLLQGVVRLASHKILILPSVLRLVCEMLRLDRSINHILNAFRRLSMKVPINESFNLWEFLLPYVKDLWNYLSD